nr:putative ribonuclease H-like domain-containing protein [Tanacetum cinerariifolium]
MDDLKLKLEKFETSSKNITELLASKINEKNSLGYNSQVFTRTMFDCDDYLSSESDCESWPPSSLYDRFQPSGGYHIFDSEDESDTKALQIVPSFVQSSEQVKTPKHSIQLAETSIPAATPKPVSPKSNSSGKRRNRKACFVCKSVDHLIKDCDYHAKKMAQPTPRNYAHRDQWLVLLSKIKVTRPRLAHPIVTKSKSPIRRHITHSQSPRTKNSPPSITAIQDPVVSGAQGKLDFEDVYFVKELKFNLFSVSQMYDKKNSVLFTDTECLVLSSDFKLPDESQVLLRVPRENNMYNVNLKNIVPSGDSICIFAKATIDESNLWHRRLSHINFKTVNKLVKCNLVRGLPTKVFENDITCVACKKGKQHRASCKTKHVSSVDQPLFRLHMDLFGPTFVKSLNKKSYYLVFTDDYSRFTWVFFLATKDETSPILKTFITGLENQLSLKVKVTRINNGTEFKNNDLNQFCGMKGIKREFSVPRTPQQNGIAERKNKTLIEAVRTMLADLFLPIPFWVEAGKFEGKVDEGFLIGYSVNSSGPTWLFDINSLTRTMNSQPVTARNQPNPSAGFQDKFDAEKPGEEVDQQYVLFLVWSSGSTNPQNYDGNATFDGKEHDFDAKNLILKSFFLQVVVLNLSAEFEDCSDNSSNEVNAAGTIVPAAELEDITYSDDENDVGAKDDFNNLETSIKEEPKRVHQALKDPSWIEVMQEELLQFRMNKARLVTQGHTQEEGIDYKEVFAPVIRIEAITLFLAYASFMGFMVYQMDVKSAFLYGTIKEEVYVCQPLGFEDPDYPNKVYKVVKALYGLHQAPRAWYETLANYLLENGFQKGKIDQTFFIKKQKRDILLVQIYVDDIIFGATNKDLCKSFEKLMKDKFQMSSIGELTFFLGIQVKQKKDGIFIKQDKYVAEILKKFRLIDGKSASTPIDTEKPLLKDPEGENVDVHTYMSMIGSLMYLTSSTLEIMFACKKQTSVATSSIEAEYVSASSCCAQVYYLYNKKSSFADLLTKAFDEKKMRDCNEKKLIQVVKIPTENNFADLLTKAFDVGRCQYLVARVNTPRSDEDKLELMKLMVFLLPKVEKVGIRVNAIDLQVNDVTRLQALVDKKKVVITEAAIREVLRLDDAEGVDCLLNEEIFTELARMGYEKPSTKLTFYKAFFSSQWKFLIHAILQCMSAKQTSWNEFSSSMVSAVICLSTGRKFNFSKYIFDSLVRNVDSTTKFYMYPCFLQLIIRKQVGDLSTHTTKYTSPTLSQKVFVNMRRVRKGFSRVETPLFEGMLVEQEIKEEGDADEHVEEVTTGDAAHGDDSAAHGEVPTLTQEPSIPSPIPPTLPPQPPQDIPTTSEVQQIPPQSPQVKPPSLPPPPQPQQTAGFPMSLLQEALDSCVALTRRVEHLEYDKVAQALEIIKLKRRVKKLEKGNKFKVLKLRRLQKVRTSQRIDTSDDTVMDDESNQGMMIDEMDMDDVVVLMDEKEEDKKVEEAKVDENAQVQGRQAESQAEIYKIDIDHVNKVLSMQEDESEPAEVQEVVDVVTTAKLITEVVTAASASIPTDEPKVLAATHTAAPARVEELKPLKKKQQIEMDEEYARKLHAELNKDIDWDVAIDQLNLKAKEDPSIQRYQAIKRKPQTKAQARKNMMMYLNNVAGFKFDYFKGMCYDEEKIEEEENRALQTINETPAEKEAKRKKLNEEVEDLKRHMEVVPDEDDDVYTEATPLARKVHVVDYEIIELNNKSYCKIIRANRTHQLYISFQTLLKNFDREDLEALWNLVKERFSTSKPKNFFDDFLLTALGAMFEKPDAHAQIWKN